MSDYDDDDLDTTEQANDKGWRKRMVAEAEERGRTESKAEADEAKRELAFIKAGIDLNTPSGKLLAKAYADGTPTVEAVKAFALEHGVIEPETPAVPAEELAAHDRVANASAGATSPNEADELQAELDKAGDFFTGSPEQVLAVLRKAGISSEYTRPGNWQRTDASQPL